jgi:hypothetical protein
LVSGSPSTPGSASVTILGAASAGASQPAILAYLQALSNTGSVPVTISAANYQNANYTVNLSTPLAVLTSPYNAATNTYTPLSAPVTFSVQLQPQTGYANAEGPRAGGPPVTVQLNSTNPAAGSLSASTLVFAPGDSSPANLTQIVSFQPLAAGATLLSLSVPSGFADPLAQREQLITVVDGNFSAGCAASVGKDLEESCDLNLIVQPAAPFSVTLTSTQPDKLLLASADVPVPAASVTVSFQNNRTDSSLFSQVGLDSSGAVPITVTSSSLPQSTLNITLHPSGFCVSSQDSNGTNFAPGTMGSVQIRPCELDSTTLAPISYPPLRFGIPLVPVSVSSSDSSVVCLSNGTIYLYGGDASANEAFNALSVGQATISVTQPPGYTSPSSGAALAVRVQ